MRHHWLAAAAAAALALAASSAAAQVPGAEAARQLFGLRGVSVAVARDLSAADAATLRELVRQQERSSMPFRYYAAIAYSPDEGLLSDALQGALNFHTPEAADAAALAACNAVRRRGARPCAVAARVLPQGWQPRPLTLSFDATNAFERVYRRQGGPKALAISPSGGAFGLGQGPAAAASAVDACNAETARLRGARDCRVAIAE